MPYALSASLQKEPRYPLGLSWRYCPQLWKTALNMLITQPGGSRRAGVLNPIQIKLNKKFLNHYVKDVFSFPLPPTKLWITRLRFYILLPTGTEIGLPLYENNTYWFVGQAKELRTTLVPERDAVIRGWKNLLFTQWWHSLFGKCSLDDQIK